MPHQETLSPQTLKEDVAPITGPMGLWTFPVLSSLSKFRPAGSDDFDEDDDVGGMVPKPAKPPQYLPDAPVPFVTHGTYFGEKTQTNYWVIGFPEWASFAIYNAETTSSRREDYIAIALWYSTAEAARADIARLF